ncbi:hypothetical protein L596_012893 [Steinernema carpocapsae]|uniref:7TM GPCR serpentine receptor class x (Srx) domain-containing protein n=2 Tax=Steinernema carpocapsae TaxID=34508 RepID=A0A4U5NYK7_STECR|nr:hypothetical protein L596_012893 [Steinernema carpocapsae]
MVYTSILDIINLLNCAVMAGILSILEVTHCNSGIWVSYFSDHIMFFWLTYCCAAEVLALNRVLEFVSSYWAAVLFEGKKIWIWIGITVIYGVAGMLAVPDRFYFYNPYGGQYPCLRRTGQPNLIHIVNNFFKLGFITTCYTLMLIFMYCRLYTLKNKISTLQIKVSIQALCMAILADAVTMGYLAASYLPLSPEIVEYTGVFGELLWIALHGGTGIIYVVLNNSVNEKLKLTLKKAVHFCRS